MKYIAAFLFIVIFTVLGFAQNSGKYVEVKRIDIRATDFQLLKSSQEAEKSINRTPPTESQLENPFTRSAPSTRLPDNHFVYIIFDSLTNKKIKSISFTFHLTQNGKKIFRRNIKDKPLYFSDATFSVRDDFFEVENLSFTNQNTARQVIVKQIIFEDGTKVKF